MQNTETKAAPSVPASLKAKSWERKTHIVLVVARGEAVRNFLYSDTLRVLSESARVTLLSVIDDEDFLARFGPYAEEVIPLTDYPERTLVTQFRYLIHTAHFRWIWSEAAKYHWGLHDARAFGPMGKLKRLTQKGMSWLLANRPSLEALTTEERWLSYRLRPTTYFDQLFAVIKPDLVFNCSHIHGPLADLPLRVAHGMGIPTAAFIFSWDNLTSRSRIFVPYDFFLVWNRQMHDQLLGLYPEIRPHQVRITGTPQFDFHFQSEYLLTREELCARIGLDPRRPYVLYTTGMDSDFLDEYKIVEAVIEHLQKTDAKNRPQLVVRTYLKGTSPEMLALAARGTPDVVFPPILWEKKWMMPMYEDLAIYSSLVHHASLGINAASTVSLELMMHDKPVINLGLEPPGSSLPHFSRFSRHIDYEHYRPVAHSGAVMVARSVNELCGMVDKGLADPGANCGERRQFLRVMFDDSLDGNAGRRVAANLVDIALKTRPKGSAAKREADAR